MRILVILFYTLVSLQSFRLMVTNPAFIICSVQSLTYRLYSKGENSASILGDEGLVNWDTKHWRDFLKPLRLYLAEDYTENLLQLHDAEIVRLRNYYEVHKELFEGVQKWEESWRLFLEFEVLP